MSKLLLSICIAFLVLSIPCNAQSPFIRAYTMPGIGGGGTETGWPQDIQMTTTGTVMLTTIDSTWTNWYSVLTGFDANGYPVWSNKISNPQNYLHFEKSCVLSDGTIACLGASTEPGNDWSTIILRLSSSGSFLWARAIVNPPGGDIGNIKETPDGNLVVCTSLMVGNNSEIAILKIDLNGTLLDQFTYTVPGEEQGGIASAADIIANSDGGYTVCGKTPLFGATLVFRTDQNGQIIWSKKDIVYCPMLTTLNASPTCMAKINNHYLITGGLGQMSPYVFFMLLDENGNLRWATVYEFPVIFAMVEDCYAPAWGTFVATGTVSVGTSVDDHPFMFKADLFGTPQNGIQIFDYTLPQNTDRMNSFGLCVSPTDDYYMGALTSEWPQNRLGLIRTDSSASSGCTVQSLVGYVPMQFYLQDCPLTSGSPASLQAATVSINAITLTTTTLCGSALTVESESSESMEADVTFEQNALVVSMAECGPDLYLGLYDVAGKLILSNQISGKQQRISTIGIAPGIYVATLHCSHDMILTKKVVIQ